MSLTVKLPGLEVPKPFYGLYVYGHNKGHHAPIILEGTQSLCGWMGVVRRCADPPPSEDRSFRIFQTTVTAFSCNLEP
jgi:hypothetical protein